MRPHVKTWKNAVLKLNVAMFDVGMGVSRLMVLVIIMAVRVCQFTVDLCLEFLLGSFFAFRNMVTERFLRIRAALGDFWKHVNCGSTREKVLYVTE